MRFLKINGRLVNQDAISLADFDETTGTLSLHLAGAGQQHFTGDDAKAAWDRLSHINPMGAASLADIGKPDPEFSLPTE